MKYIEELKKYFPVDTFGRCYRNKIYGEPLEIFKLYKFVISFENSVCVDYVTEKYIRPLLVDSIPVVASLKSTLDSYFPGTYINAFDYSNPKKLAKYLMEVSRNFTLYKNYFFWRENYTINTKINIKDPCTYINNILHVKSSKSFYDLNYHQMFNPMLCLSVEKQKELLLP